MGIYIDLGPDDLIRTPADGSGAGTGRYGDMDTHSPPGDADEQTASVKLKEVVGCTHADCHCECFLPGRRLIRSCDRCDHSWVAHAVGKVCGPAIMCSGQVEIVQSNVVFDISSLILYGTQALPVRMKILLDRLFSVLTHTQVLNIIHTLGWTLRDYVRGYMLQDSMGKVLDRWVTMSPEDEVVTLRQFLRFGETKPIVELMADGMRPDTDVERSPTLRPGERRHHFENLPGGSLAFLQPFHFLPPEPHPAARTLQRLRKQSPARRHDEPQGTRAGSTAGKGRVSCDACAKTFYDKGTLKIHFNAVHLKIKHRCTVSGCSMMFSSLRSRNRHSANPNPRLHAALQHRLRPALPVSTHLQKDLPGGGATGAANHNGLGDVIDTTPKKKSRKSSTPLRFKPEIRSQDDDLLTISPRQPVHSLHGNKHPMFKKHLPQTEYGRNDWTTGEDGEWKERCRPLLKVKEETCDPVWDCRGHRHSNL